MISASCFPLYYHHEVRSISSPFSHSFVHSFILSLHTHFLDTDRCAMVEDTDAALVFMKPNTLVGETGTNQASTEAPVKFQSWVRTTVKNHMALWEHVPGRFSLIWARGGFLEEVTVMWRSKGWGLAHQAKAAANRGPSKGKTKLWNKGAHGLLMN